MRAQKNTHSGTAGQGILARAGGIRPPPRRHSRRALTLSEREEISRRVVAGQSLRSIAVRLDRAPSTISREIKRNGGLKHYRAKDKGRNCVVIWQKPDGLEAVK